MRDLLGSPTQDSTGHIIKTQNLNPCLSMVDGLYGKLHYFSQLLKLSTLQTLHHLATGCVSFSSTPLVCVCSVTNLSSDESIALCLQNNQIVLLPANDQF